VYHSKKEVEGKIKISGTVLKNGSLRDRRIISSTINNANFERRLLKEIKLWNFGSYSQEDSVILEYDFKIKKERI